MNVSADTQTTRQSPPRQRWYANPPVYNTPHPNPKSPPTRHTVQVQIPPTVIARPTSLRTMWTVQIGLRSLRTIRGIVYPGQVTRAIVGLLRVRRSCVGSVRVVIRTIVVIPVSLLPIITSSPWSPSPPSSSYDRPLRSSLPLVLNAPRGG